MNKHSRKVGEDCEDCEDSLMGLPVYTTSSVSHQHVVYIDELITTSPKYRNVLFTLDNASGNDVVSFHLNTPGGNVDTTLQICNAIANTEAHTVAVCHGTVASCGTILALSCDETIILPNTTWMIHPLSWGLKGDTKTIKNAVDFNTKQILRLCHEVYFGFLTEEEIDNMIENSTELWMDSEEVHERLKLRESVFKDAAKALEDGEKIEKPKKKVAKKK